MTVFMDTVGLLATWDSTDQWHAAAERELKRLITLRARLVTSTLVLLECGNAAARRPYRDAVVRLWHDLKSKGRLIAPTEADVQSAWELYRSAGPTGAGIVDQTSFVLLRRLGISQVLTNDKHFKLAGFDALF